MKWEGMREVDIASSYRALLLNGHVMVFEGLRRRRVNKAHFNVILFNDFCYNS